MCYVFTVVRQCSVSSLFSVQFSFQSSESSCFRLGFVPCSAFTIEFPQPTIELMQLMLELLDGETSIEG